MKFQSWPIFSKHLRESVPNDLSPIYLILVPCSYERRKIYDKISCALHAKESDLILQYCDLSATSLQQVVQQLNCRSLLSPSFALVYDGLDRLKKEEWGPLLTYVGNPSPFAYLILGASNAKYTAELYQKGKKEIVVLDLSEEKPWDRKARFQRHLIELAEEKGKGLSGEAAQYLLDRIGLNLPHLEQELIKLICYVGDRQVVKVDDMQQVCSVEQEKGTWQLSEAIIWEKGPVAPPPGIDLSWFLPFLGQLRYQIQMGLKLTAMLDDQIAPLEIAKQIPQLKGSLLNKRVQVAKERGQEYFRLALHHLFEVELLAKNNGSTPLLLFDLFTAKLAHMR